MDDDGRGREARAGRGGAGQADTAPGTAPELALETAPETAPETATETLTPRERRKLEQILDGARACFMAGGCSGTSVDEIARRAGISKATLYRYFPDKTAVFRAVLCDATDRLVLAVGAGGCGSGCLTSMLEAIARDYITFLLSPFAQAAYRAAVAESARLPEVGRAFFESGRDAGRRRLAPALRDAAERGEIVVDDADLAAEQFFALCRAGVFDRALFGIDPEPDPARIEAQVRRAVETFLRAYRPEPAAE